jgi:DNA-binding phage protein
MYFSITLVDSNTRRTHKRIYLEPLASTAEYIAAAAGYVAALQPLTDLALERIDLVWEAITTGFAGQAGSNIDVGATFSGVLHEKNGARASHKVPGIKAALTDGMGGVPIDEPDVETYLDQFVDAADPQFLLSDGETMEAWERGILDK